MEAAQFGSGAIWKRSNLEAAQFGSGAIWKRSNLEARSDPSGPPYRCVPAGCSNTASDHVSLFKFPKDPVLRRQWEKQVQRNRAQWKATEHSHLCSEHFPSDAFHIDSAIAATCGMKKKKTLKPGAVPTLFIRPSAAAQPDSQVDSTRSRKRTTTAQAACETEGVSTTKRMRGAFEKRERSRVCYKDFLRAHVCLSIIILLYNILTSNTMTDSARSTCH